jgi:hypothetical protein
MFLHRKSSFYDNDDRIVIDFGSANIKYGISGESFPRGIFPRGKLEVSIELVIRSLLIPSESRKEIILVEDPFVSIDEKRLITSRLLHFHTFKSVSWIPSPFLAMLTVGKPTGLVIDIGNELTRVVPVFDRIPLFHYAGFTQRGKNALISKFHELLLQHGTIVEASNPRKVVETDLAHSVLDGYAFRILAGSAAEPQDIVLPLNSNTVIRIPAKVRSEGLDALFSHDPDHSSVSELILKCLKKVIAVHVVSNRYSDAVDSKLSSNWWIFHDRCDARKPLSKCAIDY